jgi:anti-anti-sigma factor
VSGISTRDGDGRDVQVKLSGEFDLHDLEDLRAALDGAAASGRAAVVDLSGVTFLDVGTTRELAVRSQLHAHQMTLRSPSAAVHASVAACGLESWFDFRVRARDVDGAALPGTT